MLAAGGLALELDCHLSILAPQHGAGQALLAPVFATVSVIAQGTAGLNALSSFHSSHLLSNAEAVDP